MELYRKVRLACRDGMSERAAARHFGVSRQSVRKMLQFSVPPGYRRTAPVRRPKLDEFTGLIEQWLEDDRRHGYRDWDNVIEFRPEIAANKREHKKWVRRFDKPTEANVRNGVAHEWMMHTAGRIRHKCPQTRGTLNSAASGSLMAGSTVQG